MNKETNEYDYILNNFDLKNKRILDVGCGNYINTLKFLAKRPKLLVGIDNKQPNAKLKTKKCLFIRSNCEKIPYKKNKFDIVTCIRVFPYVNIDKTIKEIARVTKNNGIILISCHGIGYYFSEIFKAHKLKSILCILNGLVYHIFNLKFKKVDSFQFKYKIVKILNKYDIETKKETIFKKYGIFKVLFMLYCKVNK